MREITDIKEIQKAVLNIAVEFARVMDKHRIPYYMIGGTMLGAIRHKGFIPWDDDMDIGVPRKYYERAKEVLRQELPKPYELHYGKTGRVNYDSSKIVDTTIMIEERVTSGAIIESELFIDLFPIDVCNNNYNLFSRNKWIHHFMGLNNLQYDWPDSFSHKIVAAFVHILPENFFLKLSHLLLFNKGAFSINYGGMYGAREIVPIEYFGTPQLYKFENTCLLGVEDPNRYLTGIYGNYMKLPPEEKRHTHISKCYIK